MTEKSKRGGARPGSGPKPKDPAEVMVPKSVRLTPEGWRRFEALGGVEWLRQSVDASYLRQQKNLAAQK